MKKVSNYLFLLAILLPLFLNAQQKPYRYMESLAYPYPVKKQPFLKGEKLPISIKEKEHRHSLWFMGWEATSRYIQSW